MQPAAPALGNTAKATCSGGTTTPLSPGFPTPSPSSGAGSSQPGALIFSGSPFRSISRELLMRKTTAAVFRCRACEISVTSVPSLSWQFLIKRSCVFVTIQKTAPQKTAGVFRTTGRSQPADFLRVPAHNPCGTKRRCVYFHMIVLMM